MSRLTKDEVNRLLDVWHDKPHLQRRISAPEFLGWTWPEYIAWLHIDVPPEMSETKYNEAKGRLRQYETSECN